MRVDRQKKAGYFSGPIIIMGGRERQRDRERERETCNKTKGGDADKQEMKMLKVMRLFIYLFNKLTNKLKSK